MHYTCWGNQERVSCNYRPKIWIFWLLWESRVSIVERTWQVKRYMSTLWSHLLKILHGIFLLIQTWTLMPQIIWALRSCHFPMLPSSVRGCFMGVSAELLCSYLLSTDHMVDNSCQNQGSFLPHQCPELSFVLLCYAERASWNLAVLYACVCMHAYVHVLMCV